MKIDQTFVYAHRQIYLNLGIELSDLDVQLARFITRVGSVNESAIIALLWYMCIMQREGHVAVKIAEVLDKNLLEEAHKRLNTRAAEATFPSDYIFKEEHFELLKRGRLIDHDNSIFVNDGNWLYFRRFYGYETDIVNMIRSRMVWDPIGEVPRKSGDSTGLGASGVPQDSGNKSNSSAPAEIDWQEMAIVAGLSYRSCIITGGPGTGKTYTVLNMLTRMLTARPGLRIALCAPTGKAAARLVESIEANLSTLAISKDIRDLLPQKAMTIHRLIGWNPSWGKARYNRDNPLPYDVVILDEASMVDIALLSRLSRAMLPDARFVMLGDKDQLASVEAGAVFGEIAGIPDDWSSPEKLESPTNSNSTDSRENSFKHDGRSKDGIHPSDSNPIENSNNSEISHKKSTITFPDIVVKLQKSWRFGEASEIGKLSHKVNDGNADASWELLENGEKVQILGAKSDERLEQNLLKRAKVHHQKILKTSNPAEALSTLRSFQTLSAHRKGNRGTIALNATIDAAFASDYRKNSGQSYTNDMPNWYAGRPVMMPHNDYELGVFNGDVGITLEIDGRLMVAFPTPNSESKIKWVSPAQLRKVESAWVLTVHKSQGSEYDEVVLVLPDEPSLVLTRELAYTALTRARTNFGLWGEKPVWRHMLEAKVERRSGLSDRLHGINQTPFSKSL